MPESPYRPIIRSTGRAPWRINVLISWHDDMHDLRFSKLTFSRFLPLLLLCFIIYVGFSSQARHSMKQKRKNKNNKRGRQVTSKLACQSIKPQGLQGCDATHQVVPPSSPILFNSFPGNWHHDYLISLGPPWWVKVLGGVGAAKGIESRDTKSSQIDSSWTSKGTEARAKHPKG